MMHKHLILKLAADRGLTQDEYEYLIQNRTDADAALLRQLAQELTQQIYGRSVFIRGLIEISNICKNDCLYCGIRRSNSACVRYRLTEAEILACAQTGYELGFRTFVLQGGEDGYFTDAVLCAIVRRLKERFPDCAVTLSMGERSPESYGALRQAGADRYLLRHETADSTHYSFLHPADMSYVNRMQCLQTLRELGYQVGCGFMVGSPGQTAVHLAKDLKFIEEFQPEMCGIGPFIPHRDTPFAGEPAGTADLTCFLLSMIRLICPRVLLPATTALSTIDPTGREQGILAGANVVMPNLSPARAKEHYTLYDNKLHTGAEAARNLEELQRRLCAIGRRIAIDRGDIQR